MLSAILLIVILLISGCFRIYFKHKYDVTGHLREVERASLRHEKITHKITSTINS
jgi:hypothetical protein